MPEWLHEEVKDVIPNHIGVTNGEKNLKKPKKVELGLPLNDLYINLVCALNREANKYYTNLDEDKIAGYKRVIEKYKKDGDYYYTEYAKWCNKYYELENKINGK